MRNRVTLKHGSSYQKIKIQIEREKQPGSQTYSYDLYEGKDYSVSQIVTKWNPENFGRMLVKATLQNNLNENVVYYCIFGVAAGDMDLLEVRDDGIWFNNQNRSQSNKVTATHDSSYEKIKLEFIPDNGEISSYDLKTSENDVDNKIVTNWSPFVCHAVKVKVTLSSANKPSIQHNCGFAAVGGDNDHIVVRDNGIYFNGSIRTL